MPACELQCSDVFDERRFFSETIAILRALLASTATSDTEYSILFDVQVDNTYIPFYRYFITECDGTRVIYDVEIDGVTPYTPIGSVTPELPVFEETIVSHILGVTADYAIPTGFIQGSLAVESGTADFDGVTFPTGSSLHLPPMSFNGIDRYYPELNITNVTGKVLVHYNTRV